MRIPPTTWTRKGKSAATMCSITPLTAFLSPNHNSGSNIVWADGHVSAMRNAQTTIMAFYGGSGSDRAYLKYLNPEYTP